MLRQISLISLLVFLLSTLVMLDYKSAQRLALAAHRPAPGFAEHVIGIGPRIFARIESSLGDAGSEKSDRLALMLPAVPEGWEVHRVEDGDAKALLAKSEKAGDPAVTRLVESLLAEPGPRGTDAAQMAYGRKDRLVVFKLIRQPDALFTDPARLSELDAVIAAQPSQELQDFMRVRGLDVAELALPETTRARIFTAALGGQLQLWVMASKRLADRDLLPFFETLDVAAMNALVRSHEAGLGDVPVIVVASELDEVAGAAYAADRAAREADRAARLERLRLGLAGATQEDAGSEPDSAEDGCRSSPDGVTICVVGG